MKKLISGLLSLSVMFFVACEEDDGTTEPSTSELTLNINGLEDLGSAAKYEGWVIVDGKPVSTGTFTVDASGTLSATKFQVKTSDLQAAEKFVLTVEPSPDNSADPSDQKLLAGDFSGNSASINTGIVGDFSNAAGTLFLRSPTDEATDVNNGNDQYGVWFGNPAMPPTPGFTLPALPTGWAYEGWVIGESGPLSTGTFTDFGAVDSSNGFSGTANNAGPPIPGEDFFENAPSGETFPLDVRGRTVVISVEPVPDNSEAPFLLKPLLVMLASNAATAPETHQFNQNLGSLPTGTASR